MWPGVVYGQNKVLLIPKKRITWLNFKPKKCSRKGGGYITHGWHPKWHWWTTNHHCFILQRSNCSIFFIVPSFICCIFSIDYVLSLLFNCSIISIFCHSFKKRSNFLNFFVSIFFWIFLFQFFLKAKKKKKKKSFKKKNFWSFFFGGVSPNFFPINWIPIKFEYSFSIPRSQIRRRKNKSF